MKNRILKSLLMGSMILSVSNGYSSDQLYQMFFGSSKTPAPTTSNLPPVSNNLEQQLDNPTTLAPTTSNLPPVSNNLEQQLDNPTTPATDNGVPSSTLVPPTKVDAPTDVEKVIQVINEQKSNLFSNGNNYVKMTKLAEIAFEKITKSVSDLYPVVDNLDVSGSSISKTSPAELRSVWKALLELVPGISQNEKLDAVLSQEIVNDEDTGAVKLKDLITSDEEEYATYCNMLDKKQINAAAAFDIIIKEIDLKEVAAEIKKVSSGMSSMNEFFESFKLDEKMTFDEKVKACQGLVGMVRESFSTLIAGVNSALGENKANGGNINQVCVGAITELKQTESKIADLQLAVDQAKGDVVKEIKNVEGFESLNVDDMANSLKEVSAQIENKGKSGIIAQILEGKSGRDTNTVFVFTLKDGSKNNLTFSEIANLCIDAKISVKDLSCAADWVNVIDMLKGAQYKGFEILNIEEKV